VELDDVWLLVHELDDLAPSQEGFIHLFFLLATTEGTNQPAEHLAGCHCLGLWLFYPQQALITIKVNIYK
jgi:hypothetical protein